MANSRDDGILRIGSRRLSIGVGCIRQRNAAWLKFCVAMTKREPVAPSSYRLGERSGFWWRDDLVSNASAAVKPK